MATIITTLKTHTNQDTVYPNIRTENIPDSSVTVTKIQDGAVSSAKIASGAVTTAKIADSNVTTAKIADSNVTTAKIADSNVTTAKLEDEAVTSAKIKEGAVTASRIANNAITYSTMTYTTKKLSQIITDYGGPTQTLFMALIKAVFDYRFRMSYQYQSGGDYCHVTISDIRLCYNSTTPANKKMVMHFTLVDGTAKTVTFDSNNPLPTEATDIILCYPAGLSF